MKTITAVALTLLFLGVSCSSDTSSVDEDVSSDSSYTDGSTNSDADLTDTGHDTDVGIHVKDADLIEDAGTDVSLSEGSECQVPIDSCPISRTPSDFNYDTCQEFECYDILSICISNDEGSVFDLQSALRSVGKFVCSDTNVSSCVASGIQCDSGVCCVLDQLDPVGTFKSTFYDDICSASDLVVGVGCLELE